MQYLILGHDVLEEWVKPQTMKVRARINGVPALMLVDSGATHNFVSRKLVKAMGWPVVASKVMQTKSGDGYKAHAQGMCKGVTLEMDSLQFIVDTVLFDLEGIDLILGVAWLVPLGEMQVDWGEQAMKLK